MDVLQRLIEAIYTKRRGDCLADANLGIENCGFSAVWHTICVTWIIAGMNMRRDPSTKPDA